MNLVDVVTKEVTQTGCDLSVRHHHNNARASLVIITIQLVIIYLELYFTTTQDAIYS